MNFLKIKCPLDLPSAYCPVCYFNGGYSCNYFPFHKEIRICTCAYEPDETIELNICPNCGGEKA